MRQFKRGERAKLSELAAINHIWEVEVGIEAPFFIVDFCCLGLDASGEVIDNRYLVSLNQPEAPQDAITLNNASNDGAIFTLNLGRLPAAVRRLVFTATLHQPEMPGGLLGAAFSFLGGINTNIGEGHLTLRTPAIDSGFFAFSGQDFGEESTLVLGELYWRDEWRFVAAGQPLKGQLSAFLQSLTDGPMPAALPVPTPKSKSPSPAMAAPPRPPRAAPTPAPKPRIPTPAPRVAQPRAPISAPSPSPAPKIPVKAPVLPVKALVIAPPVAPHIEPQYPRSLPPGGKLQDLIDAAAPNSTLTLMRGEYQGPITIRKPLSLEGGDSALWSKVGPVITIASPQVQLHDLDVEITISPDAPGDEGVAVKVEKQVSQLELDNVRLRGRISGLGDADGEWILPSRLDLGQFAPRAISEFTFSVRVPTSVRLNSPIDGVTISPAEVGAGEHRITLQVRDVIPETLILGAVEVRSASLLRTISLSGIATVGVAPQLAKEL